VTAPEDRLTLRVGGRIFEGWESVSIETGIEQIAGSFQLALTERWPNQLEAWTIPPGEYCEIAIGGEPVISGYVDSASVSYDAAAHGLGVSGRDRTGDIVDCSAPATSFAGLSFVEIARRLVAPYHITVRDEAGVAGKKVPKCAIQPGESVFQTLETLARQAAVLLVSDGRGALVITRAGKAGEAVDRLIEGENILSASFEHNHGELYSSITIKGQAAAAASSNYDLSAAAPKGEVKRAPSTTTTNSEVGRHRPLVIVAETEADAKRCQQRAAWEASTREAKSRRLNIAVQGWRQSDGSLWRINQTVSVVSPMLRLDERWLIAGVSYTLDDGGTTTSLTLTGPHAYDILPEIPPATSKPGSKSTDDDVPGGRYDVIG